MRTTVMTTFFLLIHFSAAHSQSTFDTLNFLNNYNSTKCIGEVGTWQGMTCNSSDNARNEQELLRKHRVDSEDGTVIDLQKRIEEDEVSEEIEKFADFLARE